MSAAKNTKSKSKAKPTAKATKGPAKSPTKSASKPTPKAAKAVAKPSAKSTPKPPVKPSKPEAKPAKVAGKVAARGVAGKPVPEKPVAAKANKGKVAESVEPKAQQKISTVKAEKPAKAAKSKKAIVQDEADSELAADLIASTDDMDAEIGAEDLEIVDATEVVSEPPEELSPSAALLRAMKPTSPDAEKASEKKKKKDDLKLDRNGDLEAQWAQLKEKYKALKPVAYKMSESFEARTPILHKVLGWGFIITNQNDRLEVLFQQGIKFLISNYKA